MALPKFPKTFTVDHPCRSKAHSERSSAAREQGKSCRSPVLPEVSFECVHQAGRVSRYGEDYFRT